MTFHAATDRLDLIKRYLRTRGWERIDHPNENLLFFQGPNDDANRPIKLVLPTSPKFEDSKEIAQKALRLLSGLENRTLDEVGSEIIRIGYDVLRQRIIMPEHNSTLPLSMAKSVVDAMTHLIRFSACLEEHNQPFFPRIKTGIAKKFVDKCRFGQTFIGSFGTSIEMPIPPPSTENPLQIPFERRIMERIAHGFRTIQQAVLEADTSILIADYKKGFNANLYEVVQDLGENLPNCQFELSFSWSSEYKPPSSISRSSPILLVPKEVCPFLESAAKALRTCSESEDTTIVGRVVQLRGDNHMQEESNDMIPSSEISGKKMIVVEWKDNKVQIRVVLDQDQYRIACDAHKNNSLIQVRGKPEKRGRHFYLTFATAFQLV